MRLSRANSGLSSNDVCALSEVQRRPQTLSSFVFHSIPFDKVYQQDDSDQIRFNSFIDNHDGPNSY